MDHSTVLKLFFLCYCMIANADDCVQTSPCSCMFSNGTGIDLAPSKRTIYTSNRITTRYRDIGPLVNYTFYFHPCSDIPLVLRPFEMNSCSGRVSICKYYEHSNGQGYELVGNANKTQFASDGSYIEYSNIRTSTYVHLVCGDTKGKLDVTDVSDPNKTILIFTSRNACFRQIGAPLVPTTSTLTNTESPLSTAPPADVVQINQE